MSVWIDRGTVSHQAEAALRSMVLEGQLAIGQRLNEVELSNELQISRGPLREAIQRLAGEGLLRLVSHRGAYVRTFEPQEVVELYELRAALELHAVRLVARRASEEEIESLAELLSEAKAVVLDSTPHPYPSDLDFHQRLVALSGNQALLKATVDAHRQLSLARSRSGHVPVRARRAVDEHAGVLEALRSREADEAASLLSEHLDHSMRNALEILGLTEPK